MGYSAGSTGEPLWRDTGRDPMASRSGGILGGIQDTRRDHLAGYSRDPLASSSGEILGGIHSSSSGGILGGIHWRAALAGNWVGAWFRSIANADSNIKSNNPFLSGGEQLQNQPSSANNCLNRPNSCKQPHEVPARFSQTSPRSCLNQPWSSTKKSKFPLSRTWRNALKVITLNPQAASQPTNQPTNHPTSQPANSQSANHPANHACQGAKQTNTALTWVCVCVKWPTPKQCEGTDHPLQNRLARTLYKVHGRSCAGSPWEDLDTQFVATSGCKSSKQGPMRSLVQIPCRKITPRGQCSTHTPPQRERSNANEVRKGFAVDFRHSHRVATRATRHTPSPQGSYQCKKLPPCHGETTETRSAPP